MENVEDQALDVGLVPGPCWGEEGEEEEEEKEKVEEE